LPIEAKVASGSSGTPGGSSGFSTKRVIWPTASASMQPKALAVDRGTLIPATVTPAPVVTCWPTICEGSIRYTWSAPNTTM